MSIFLVFPVQSVIGQEHSMSCRFASNIETANSILKGDAVVTTYVKQSIKRSLTSKQLRRTLDAAGMEFAQVYLNWGLRFTVVADRALVMSPKLKAWPWAAEPS